MSISKLSKLIFPPCAYTLITKKYYGIWVNVESAVWDDLRLQQKICKIKLPAKFARVIAYNAAFMATSEHHKEIRKVSHALAPRTKA